MTSSTKNIEIDLFIEKYFGLSESLKKMPETVGDVQRGELGVNSVELRDATRDETKTDNMHPCKQLLLVWKELVVILTPIVLLPIPILWPDGVSNFAINDRYLRL